MTGRHTHILAWLSLVTACCSAAGAATEFGIFVGRDPRFILAQHERALVVGAELVKDLGHGFVFDPNVTFCHFHEPVANEGDAWGAINADAAYRFTRGHVQVWLGAGVGYYTESSARVVSPLAATGFGVARLGGLSFGNGGYSVFAQGKQRMRRLLDRRSRLDYTVVVGIRAVVGGRK
jgi:hypothetical protein